MYEEFKYDKYSYEEFKYQHCKVVNFVMYELCTRMNFVNVGRIKI